MEEDIIKDFSTNILKWYEFKKNSNILYLGTNLQILNYLSRTNQVSSTVLENLTDKKQYDYIIVDCQKVKGKDIEKLKENLAQEGTVIFILDNQYGITRFITYNYKEQISSLEERKQYPNIEEICSTLKQQGFVTKKYMIFPNKEKVDMILREDFEDLLDKVGKYFYNYKEEQVILCDEANVMKNILQYDKELYKKLANSYLIEATINTKENDIKYVSFNNYRKDKYRLITKIRENIVEKQPENEQAKEHIKEIGQNIKELKKYNFRILDKYENDSLYSELIKNRETLDIYLANNSENTDYIVNILIKIEKELLKNSLKYENIKNKQDIFLLQEYNDENLKKLNFLEYAFYDLVPKNCFYINDIFYFFDQEWMEKYLTVEFIIYRSIINSYDLVKKIDINDILKKLNILEYKELFEKIDTKLREKVTDIAKLKICNKEYKKMYEIIYENKILIQQNKNQENLIEEYKENNRKQDVYIKALEQENDILKEKNKKKKLFGKV